MSVANSSSNILGRLWVERLVGGNITGIGIVVGGDVAVVAGCVVGGVVVVLVLVVVAPVLKTYEIVHVILYYCSLRNFCQIILL